jgi:hypothetical protein
MEFRHGSQFEFICGIRDFKHVISLKEISPVSEIILFSEQNDLRHLVCSEIATAAFQPRNDAFGLRAPFPDLRHHEEAEGRRGDLDGRNRLGIRGHFVLRI